MGALADHAAARKSVARLHWLVGSGCIEWMELVSWRSPWPSPALSRRWSPATCTSCRWKNRFGRHRQAEGLLSESFLDQHGDL